LTSSRLRLAIGWLEVFGASLGALVAYQIFPQLAAVLLPLAVAFILFFTLIGLAGILLVRNHPWGLPLSLLAQGIQIPVFLSPGPSFYSSAGLGLRLTVDSHWSPGFYVFFGTQLHYSWQSDRTTTAVGINLVAAVILYLLVTRVEESNSAGARVGANGAA
jgi:hypothetical protein